MKIVVLAALAATFSQIAACSGSSSSQTQTAEVSTDTGASSGGTSGTDTTVSSGTGTGTSTAQIQKPSVSSGVRAPAIASGVNVAVQDGSAGSTGTDVMATGTATATAAASTLKLTDPTCVDPDLTKVMSGVTLTLCNGTTGVGTYAPPASPDLTNLVAGNIKAGVSINGTTGSLTPESHSNCAGNGQVGCVTTSTYQSADLTNLAAGNVKSGVTVAGVTGSVVVESHSDCTGNAQTGCVATTTYKSADLTNLTAANIKASVSVAGVAGQYPSPTYPLTGKLGGVAELDSATFDAKIKSSASFQWFDAEGNNYSGAGDTNIAAGNVLSGVTIFGATGTVVIPTVDAWDLRAGVSVGSTSGQLQLDCQNGFVSSGSAYCSGSNFSVKNLAGNADCSSGSSNCEIYDAVSKLYWSPTSASTAGFGQSQINCGGYSGESGWRFPTVDEVEQALAEGITAVSAPAFLPFGGEQVWTFTPGAAGYHYVIAMNGGNTFQAASTTSTPTYSYICVHN